MTAVTNADFFETVWEYHNARSRCITVGSKCIFIWWEDKCRFSCTHIHPFPSTIRWVPCSGVFMCGITCGMCTLYYTLHTYLFLSTIPSAPRSVVCMYVWYYMWYVCVVCICGMYVWYYVWYVYVVLYCLHIPFSEYDPVCTLFSCCLQWYVWWFKLL